MVPEEELAGDCAVVIDVLRATTTIVHALEAGAEYILPCPEIENAFIEADRLGRDQTLIGGEKGGVIIEGFDLGNSPITYTPEKVAGKKIVLRTTNGVKALMTTKKAATIYTAAFSNLTAVVETLLQREEDIHIVCSGTDGHITAEDCLCAGAIASELMKRTDGWNLATDPTKMALALYEKEAVTKESLTQALHESRGGRNLHRTGQEADIDRAAKWDTIPRVPVWDKHKNQITLLNN